MPPQCGFWRRMMTESGMGLCWRDSGAAGGMEIRETMGWKV